MSNRNLPRPWAALISVSIILLGLILAVWAARTGPLFSAESEQVVSDQQPGTENGDQVVPTTGQSEIATLVPATPEPTATPTPVTLALAADLPPEFARIVQEVVQRASPASQPLLAPDGATATLSLDLESDQGRPLYTQLFAAATRFDTIFPELAWQTLETRWQGNPDSDPTDKMIVVLSPTLPALTHLLGPPGDAVTVTQTITEVQQLVQAESALALIPFEFLRPDLTVLAIDGQNPVENAALFDPQVYPLAVTVYAHGDAPIGPRLMEEIVAQSGASNRDPSRLTVIAMTGVTAMVRQTAYQMDIYGDAWPAEVVGPLLSQADLTVVSNEVPFVPGCETNTDMNNLTFCSKPSYMTALDGVGVDLVGLTGNHQNDYGRVDAVTSLEIYAEHGLPVYGGGRNKEAAFKPLYVEHNGNRLAFLGANSYGPGFAWATDEQPGSAEFDLSILSATIRNVHAKDLADVVLAELQYQESYDVQPLFDQRQNFRALSQAGADIVTGVQSHVPQAMEFEEGKLILYGLGNFFFDQMWSMSTREAMVVKHTIYQGRHISTQVLTTMLVDYGQPHWATPEERERILQRVFGASYWE